MLATFQANDPVTLTAELFLIPLDAGRHLVYAPLRRAAFIANAPLTNALVDLQEGGAEGIDPGLIDFLKRLSIVEGEPEQPPITRFAGTPKPTQVTLFLTTACNLRCTYCYASAGDTPLKSMKLETAQRGIDFVATNAEQTPERHFEIAYHGGGEPTVNWSVLTESFAYAQELADQRGLTLSAAAASNGVLRDDQIDWIIAHLAGGVSVSYDGLPEAHDRHRLTLLGQGSSHRVAHTLRRFDEADYPYGVRVTVTRDQIARLPASIEYICENFHPGRIQVEPSYQLGRWAGAPSAETEDFIEAFREAQLRARHHGREICYSAARLDSLTNHFCGITQDSFALTPDGNVSACYEAFSEDNPFRDIFFYGAPSEADAGYRFELPVIDHLRNQSVENRAFCQGCYAKWHCAGDCYHKSLSINGRVEFQGSERCHITRELLKDEILTRIELSGGLFWHEPPGDQQQRSRGKELL